MVGLSECVRVAYGRPFWVRQRLVLLGCRDVGNSESCDAERFLAERSAPRIFSWLLHVRGGPPPQLTVRSKWVIQPCSVSADGGWSSCNGFRMIKCLVIDGIDSARELLSPFFPLGLILPVLFDLLPPTLFLLRASSLSQNSAPHRRTYVTSSDGLFRCLLDKVSWTNLWLV